MQKLVNECVPPRAMFVKLQFLHSYLNFIGDGIVFQYEKLEGIGVANFFVIICYDFHVYISAVFS